MQPLLKFDQTIRPNVSVDPRDAPRLATQAERILDRLRQGVTPTAELVAIARQYNARLFELRRAGYVIELASRNYHTGETAYRLVSEPAR